MTAFIITPDTKLQQSSAQEGAESMRNPPDEFAYAKLQQSSAQEGAESRCR